VKFQCDTRSVVAEDALAQGVGEGDDRGEDEEEHARQEHAAEACIGIEAGERHGPGVEEDDFDVEDEKRHGDNIEADVKSAADCGDRVHARFVHDSFGLTRSGGPDQVREGHDDRSGQEYGEQEDACWAILGKRVDGQASNHGQQFTGSYATGKRGAKPRRPAMGVTASSYGVSGGRTLHFRVQCHGQVADGVS